MIGVPPRTPRYCEQDEGAGLNDLKARLVDEAHQIGFDLTRVCRPWDVPEVPERLDAFVEAGYHGQMGWMAERMHWRGTTLISIFDRGSTPNPEVL